MEPGSIPDWRTEDRLVAINTLTNKVMATSPIGRGCQAFTYVPNAVPSGAGTQGLVSLGIAEQATHSPLVPLSHGQRRRAAGAHQCLAFDQGSVQVLPGRGSGLEPISLRARALQRSACGGALEPLEAFHDDQAGAAIVTPVGRSDKSVQEGQRAHAATW